MSRTRQQILPDISVLLHRPCVETKTRFTEFPLLQDVISNGMRCLCFIWDAYR